jgi:hypothetical protein
MDKPQPVEYPYELPQTRGYTNYLWDGVLFEEDGGQNIPFPHPWIANYSIPQYQDWSWGGHNLIHNQFSKPASLALTVGSSGVAASLAGAAIGAAVGTYISPGYGTLVGGIAMTVITAALFLFGYFFILDERDCLWWWINYDFIDWLNNWAWWLELLVITGNEHLAEGAVEAEFFTNGYLKIGGAPAFQGWNVNIGNPAPPPPIYYALSATKSSTGDGDVLNVGNIVGAPDTSYAYLKSGSYLNKAEITATMSSTPISGTLYLKCYTPSANGANLKVYVCNTAGVWTRVVNTNLYPANTVMDVNCGYVTNIVQVSVVAYHEFYINGVYYPSNIYADAVWVQ